MLDGLLKTECHLAVGLGHVCLVTSSMTVVKTKIEINIPRKRRGHCEQHDKALIRFYDAIMQGILRHIRFDVVKCVLVASPGFVKVGPPLGVCHCVCVACVLCCVYLRAYLCVCTLV